MDEVIILEESGVTVKGYRHRTTVPKRVFRFLKLKDKDKLQWAVSKDGKVVLRKQP
ncbi:MAG: hypothetical protein V1676_03990 [Candidatus Diapherotrites archaeon]